MEATAQDQYGSPSRKHRRVVVARHGGPEVLQVLEEDIPEPRAVCLVVNYLTAHVLLHPTTNVRRGERVLVHGEAGGVGTPLLERGGYAERVVLVAEKG